MDAVADMCPASIVVNHGQWSWSWIWIGSRMWTIIKGSNRPGCSGGAIVALVALAKAFPVVEAGKIRCCCCIVLMGFFLVISRRSVALLAVAIDLGLLAVLRGVQWKC